MQDSKLEQYFFIAIFIGVGALAFFLFRPYLSALILAAVCAVLTHPLFEKLRRLSLGKSTAAWISVLVAVLLVAVPLSFLGVLLYEEAQSAGSHVTGGLGAGFGAVLEPLEARVNQWLPEAFHVSAQDALQSGALWVTNNVGSIFAGTANFVLQLFVGLMALFYFLRDGEAFTSLFLKLSPLNDRYDRQILKKLKETINGVVRGKIFLSFLQGALAGVALWVVGIPNPVLWGSVAAIGALIPNIGTGIVLAPAVVYLFATGSVVESVGLTLWGFLVIGLVDNFLLPRLIGGSTHIHPLLLLFGVLGGLSFFGPAGIIFGPIAVALLYVCVDIYFVLVGKKEDMFEKGR